MTDEEARAKGLPIESEFIQEGASSIQFVLGYDPYLIAEDIEIER